MAGISDNQTTRLFVYLLKNRVVDIEFPEGIPPGGKITLGADFAPRGKRAVVRCEAKAKAKAKKASNA
jgi:hypothetical protein